VIAMEKKGIGGTPGSFLFENIKPNWSMGIDVESVLVTKMVIWAIPWIATLESCFTKGAGGGGGYSALAPLPPLPIFLCFQKDLCRRGGGTPKWFPHIVFLAVIWWVFIF